MIIELYGAITPYTNYKYWWVDSIVKQTIMLMDKSGLRRKGSIPPDPAKQIAPLDQKQVTSILSSLGIGSAETEEQKVERIRKETNNG